MTTLVALFRPLASWRARLLPRIAAHPGPRPESISARGAGASPRGAHTPARPADRLARDDDAPVTRSLVLTQGQEALQWLARGAVLHVHCGALTVEEVPRFWAGLAWRQTWALPRGRVRVAPRSGWVRLTAGPAGCELSARLPAGRHCPPPPRC